MAGYSDTRQLIIDTLMGRPAGTEIQPEDHQAFALQITDYIRSVELVAGNATPIGFADASTVPVQPDNGQAVYLSSVGGAQTVVFSNFIDQNGNAISVTSTTNVIKLVTLLWNGQYWSSQVTSVDAVRDTINGYLFMGVATPTTIPDTSGGKVFYLATQAGDYNNFGVTIPDEELTSLQWDGTRWYALRIGDFVTPEELERAASVRCKLIGDGNNLVSTRFADGLPSGKKLRITLSNPEVDYEGVTYTSSTYDRFVISARKSDGTSISSLVRLGMESRESLKSYYDIEIPEDTNHLLVAMRAASGFVQTFWISETIINDLKTGGVENALTAEQGVILGSLATKVRMIGEDNTLVRSNFIKGVPTGKYRIHLNNPNIDTTGVTVSGGFDLFNLVAFNKNLENLEVLIVKKTGDTLQEQYDVTVPDGCYALRFGMRASKGEEQIVTISDISLELEISKNKFDIEKTKFESILTSGKSAEWAYVTDNVYVQNRIASVIKGTSFAIGTALTELNFFDQANSKLLSIDLPNVDNLEWLKVEGHFSTATSYGSFLLDENDFVVGVLVNKNHSADTMAVPVPKSAKKLLLTIMNENYPKITCYPYSELEYVSNDVRGASLSLDSFINTGFQGVGFKVNDSIVGTTINDYFGNQITIDDRSSAFYYLVPVSGYKTLKCTHFKTSSNYGSIFLDENLVIVGGFYRRYDSETNTTNLISIPDNAKFMLYCCYKNMTTPAHVELFNEGINSSTDDMFTFVNRDVVDGNIVDSKESIMSPVICMDKGFHISLNEEYEFKSAHLYYNGEIICADFVPNPSGGGGSIATPFQYFGNKVFSMNQILPQMGIRLVVKRTDGREINKSDLIIKEWTTIDYSEFKRLDAESIPVDKAKIARKRLTQLLNLVWKVEENIYPSNPSDYSTTHFKKGRTYIASPYSEASEFSKYLGWCVSFRTFLTACMNKRSVMYTERISDSNKKSAYGIDYNGLGSFYCNPYYGTVCTGLTQYVLNLPNLYVSRDYHNGSVPNTTKIAGATSANVLPFDYLWNEGHCSIISDILLDEEGNRKYIVWAEQTFPVSKNTVYTLEEFDKRCADKSIEVWRYNNWDTVTEPEPTPYIQSGKYEWQTPLVVDEDIHLFCGDYAAFAKGDPIFFNANREKGYTQLEVYAESDEEMTNVLASINLSTLANDGLYPEEDWVIVDFTVNSLEAGKYKARLVGNNIASGVVHFELVEVSLEASYVSGASTTDITYSCSSNGVPVLLRRERITGMYSGVEIVSSSGTVTVNWNDYSYYNYIKVYVKCDYGMVVKRIKMQDI